MRKHHTTPHNEDMEEEVQGIQDDDDKMANLEPPLLEETMMKTPRV